MTAADYPEHLLARQSAPPCRHARAGIELRVTPSVWPFWREVATSTIEYSGSRLRNAAEAS